MKTSPVAATLAGIALGVLAIGLMLLATLIPAVPSPSDCFTLAAALATTACAWQLTQPRR